jgi:hypothetical protein
VRIALSLLLAAALAGGAAAPAALAAQRHPHLEVQLAPPGARSEGPLVRGVNIVADGEMREMLRSGFPARLRFRVELWSVGGWANQFEGTTAWDVVLAYDHLDKSYVAARFVQERRTPLGRFAAFAGAEAAIALPFRAPIAPPPRASGEYYYNVVLDVESLSFSDLDEVERWLRGELRPAVRGERNPGTALTRGVRTLMARLLGGQRRHYELQSATFRVGS